MTPSSTDTPRWEKLRDRWPNAAASRFVDAAGLRWHVQVLGAGPAIVLLHGSGAANHSWRDVAPRLASRFTVVAPDLPGHGFTTRPAAERMALHAFTDDALALLDTLGVTPACVVGHSAGAAVALSMAVARDIPAVVGVNAALAMAHAMPHLFTDGLRALARGSMLGSLTAALATSDTIFRRLLQSTGSVVSPEQFALYRTFARSPAHAGAVMQMFAHWELDPLLRALPSLRSRVTFVVGDRDAWVPPAVSTRVAATMPHARVISIDGAGHLAHEEFPERVAAIIADAADAVSG